MRLTDIIGPVMVGPSSSHTAGAVWIGYVCRRLLGERPVRAEILFHGSFLSTGRGHGTDRAVVAGLLGMRPDDARIPRSFDAAREAGLDFTFGAVDLGDEAHPNSVLLRLTGEHGKTMEIAASSVGGGRIRIDTVDGQRAGFSGECPTLIVTNEDRPGLVADVTLLLRQSSVNIANMYLHRSGRGGCAIMTVECDQSIPADALERIRAMAGVFGVTYLDLQEDTDT